MQEWGVMGRVVWLLEHWRAQILLNPRHHFREHIIWFGQQQLFEPMMLSLLQLV